MPAPIGNQFWKQRSKHGRDKIFSNPDELWDASCEYFEWVDSNPLIAYEWNGKDPIKCDLEKMRPFTLKGLCLFLGVNEKYFNHIEQTNEDFVNVSTRIRDIIFTQKFEGAAAGFFNPNIMSRDLGLVDKQEKHSTGDGIKVLIGQNKGEPVQGLETKVNE